MTKTKKTDMPNVGSVLRITGDKHNEEWYRTPKFRANEFWLVTQAYDSQATTDSYNDYVPGEHMLKLKKLHGDGSYNSAAKEVEVSYDYSYQVGLKKEQVEVVGYMEQTWKFSSWDLGKLHSLPQIRTKDA